MARRDQPGAAPGPFVDPRVTDPVALKYAADIKARKGPDKYSTPVAGGANPPIPRLDMPHQEGMTMADQARAAAQPPPGSVVDPNSNIFPSSGGLQMPKMSRPPQHLLPADILPETAKADPEFREGQGSMYATAQPHLAYRYGVIRNKVHIQPQQLAGGRTGLSEKSVEDIQRLQAIQQGQAPSPVSLEQQAKDQAEGRASVAAQTAAAAGPAGTGARVAGGAEQLSDEDKKKVRQVIDQLDDFDWNTFKQMTMKDILNNEEQRKIVEDRLKDSPLLIDDLIVNGHVRQRIPIIPGKFEPTFQSLGGDEELAVKRIIVQEAKSLDVNDQYLLDKQAMMQVCCSLYSINTTIVGSHRDDQGNFSDERFLTKFNKVIKYPLHMLASLSIHAFWFDVRVRKLFVAENLGNG